MQRRPAISSRFARLSTNLALMLTPFAPHVAEELYSVIVGNENGMMANNARFPDFEAEIAISDEIEIPVQINGKLRARVMASSDISDYDLARRMISSGSKSGNRALLAKMPFSLPATTE